jgi:hypothetical protein
MNEANERPGFLVSRLEVWLLSGLLIWIGILGEHAVTWEDNLINWGVLALAQIPAFIFYWNRTRWLQVLTRRQYFFYWLLCFGFFVPAITVLCVMFKP